MKSLQWYVCTGLEAPSRITANLLISIYLGWNQFGSLGIISVQMSVWWSLQITLGMFFCLVYCLRPHFPENILSIFVLQRRINMLQVIFPPAFYSFQHLPFWENSESFSSVSTEQCPLELLLALQSGASIMGCFLLYCFVCTFTNADDVIFLFVRSVFVSTLNNQNQSPFWGARDCFLAGTGEQQRLGEMISLCAKLSW